MHILVTGGSGFIGSHLIAKLLEDGHSVINLDNFDDYYDYRIKIRNTLESVGKPLAVEYSQKETDINWLTDHVQSSGYRLVYADIRDTATLESIFQNEKIDAVIHLAALAGVRPSIERPLEYEEVNIRGTMNLWECCRKFDIKKFINASSSSVYGNNTKTPFAETDNVDRPISPYAATKKCTEILGHVYHHLYGIDMIHLRFFTVYGPRQRPDLAIHKFARQITEQQNIPFYGDGSTCRDYTFIDDIIDGITKALAYLTEHTHVYEILNLGESEVISLNEMVSTLEDALETPAQRQMLPMQPGDVDKTNADISKARSLIGYAPHTTFRDGIKIFVEWFLGKNKQ